MPENKFKALTISFDNINGETQYYVATQGVTAEQVLAGNDAGLVCLCFTKELADHLTRLLNADPASVPMPQPEPAGDG